MNVLENKPTIGIALGSGAARGLAHIGVLKALEENNIDVDVVAGCSSGALIGSLYCCDIKPSMIGDIAARVDRKLWVDITVPKRGIIKGKKVEEMIKLLTKGKRIEQLSKKFIAVATDLKSSEKYVFEEGPICEAVRASISIPGVFEPVKVKDMILVDGAVLDRIPVSEIKKIGSDITIAVDLGYTVFQSKKNNILDTIIQSIDLLTRNATLNKKLEADIIIAPDLSHIGPTRFDLVEECVEIGYKATLAKMDDIVKKINEYE
ncbi:patatin-like phospholipase family protein [Gottschalkia acidurici]|uniref:patatin-like phospholipase family protein n=1 Tax=Clostridium acidurici TaxID=1556 RepID=UPI002253FFD1|nr:patatin-like phospholipase family protein [Gottschalkia acidurici]